MPITAIHRILPCLCLAATAMLGTLAAQTPDSITWTRADTLRGSFDTPGRAWWDVVFYDLEVSVNPADSTIRGRNAITYRVLRPGRLLQVDLMTPLEVDSMVQEGRRVPFRREGNAYFASLPSSHPGSVPTIEVYYHGRPRVAPNPPWDGGFSWGADSLGRSWIVTTDQGMGASVWWPNKDTQADEPDSQRIAITVPAPLVDVSNGRLRRVTPNPDGTTTWEWFVVNPINNYAITVNAGHYAHWSEFLEGERGTLTLDFWPLDYHLEAARRQFPQARTTLKCFEHWFGPYPWYEDGYKLIEVSHNGMEHQSAVAYGNGYANGYRGRDASGTGLGMKWDFIIVHETAHEWWGNNITTSDLADMWVHESFANYAEGLYTECLFGEEAGARYIIGSRKGVRNDRPIVPPHRGVNAQGSGDMYIKGGNMLHTIRQLVGDDEKWRSILRGLNETFRHQIVTGMQVQDYISTRSGMDLSRVFRQYLTTTEVPLLEYSRSDSTLTYRWDNVVPGFDMPLEVTIGAAHHTLHPDTTWQSIRAGEGEEFTVDPDYYVETRQVSASASSPGIGPSLTPQESGTTSTLMAISAVNEEVAWASGTGGTFTVTTDGGDTWRSGTVPGADSLQFRDVHAISAREAYLLSIGTGPDSRIYRTRDGGATWNLQYQASDSAFYDCFAFWDDEHGLVMGDEVEGQLPVLRTSDGSTWKNIGANLPPAQEGEGAFASSGTCVTTLGDQHAWIVTGAAEHSRVLATADGGDTWESYGTPVAQGTDGSGGFSIDFRTSLDGVLGGGDLQRDQVVPNFARTSDGGKTWELAGPAPVPGAIYGLSYAGRGPDAQYVVATGPGGVAWSPDEGDTWHLLAGLKDYWAVTFAGEGAGWLVGTEGRILKATF